MAKNTVPFVQGVLIEFANNLQPAPLEEIARAAEDHLSLPLNRTWSAGVLTSNGFTVDDQPDQRVVRKPGVCIDPAPDEA